MKSETNQKVVPTGLWLRIVDWRQWSIMTRLMVIAVFPVMYLFFSVISYSFVARSREMHEDLAARAKTIATALAEGLEYQVLAKNEAAIRQMIYGVIQSDKNIYRIDVLDSNKAELTHLQVAEKDKNQAPVLVSLELPIRRQLVWVNLMQDKASRETDSGSQEARALVEKSAENNVGTLGFVRVTMTGGYLAQMQKQRFLLELMMALLALCVSAWLVWYLSTSLTRPLRTAVQALRDISVGRTDTQIVIDTGGEIGVLQQSINEMARNLHLAQQDLENKVAARTQELILSRNDALKADAEKRRLIHKVNSIVEAERQSIAVEIHDELNASLIAVRLEAERIARIAVQTSTQTAAQIAANIAPDQSTTASLLEMQERAKAVVKLALDLYANGRNLVRRLRPEVLDMLGLDGAVEDMLRVYNAAQSQCEFRFVASGDFAGLDADFSISAYRIVQEATSNIVKHARASLVDITLDITIEADSGQRHLSIRVDDNGQGFNTDQVVAGIGISGMRERVLVLNGEFQLLSEIGAGTQISIRLPLGVA